MATIYTLTIDPAALGITKPVDSVYIKNLYVDTDDAHIITAPFEYGAAVIGETTFAELPPTTLGSIYQIQLFGTEGMVLSVFFGMPERNSLLSELAIYTAYPPRSYYPEASIAWGQLKGSITNQTDLVAVMFTKIEGQVLKTELGDRIVTNINSIAGLTELTGLHTADLVSLAIRETNNELAISGLDTLTKSHTAKNTAQDTAISDNDAAINLKVDGIKLSTDAEVALKAGIADVNAKNVLQDTAITAANNLAAAAIPTTQKGAANGVATLGADSKLTPSQLPPIPAGVEVVNVTGQSTTKAVSQKLFTDTVGDIGAALDAINGVVV